ncbi:peptidoglycan editing factor PgeF [Candidatus Pelagibacter sp.]|nr:peptidoglycan editing factor PgeF [Candidatus Pelagibacter sp.]
MIKSKKLKKIKNLNHGFFNRNGGKSKNIYKSLNCGSGSKDLLSNVKKNLQIVKKKIDRSAKNIFLLQQVHSNKFIFIDDKYRLKTKPKADAIITNQKNLPIAVLTADCVPILICDDKKNIIAAIHAGWKGAYKDIIKKVIKFMIKKNCMLKNITAAIGPCIAVKNYEVKQDFKKKFLKKSKKNEIFFKKIKEKYYFNLNKYIYSQLKNLGVMNIDIINKDTFNKKNNFFSARRSISRKENDYGRNISIIMIN